MEKGESGLDVFMVVESLAACLHCSKMTIYRRCKNGEIPFIKIGRRLLFRRSELDLWLRSQGRTGGKRQEGEAV